MKTKGAYHLGAQGILFLLSSTVLFGPTNSYTWVHGGADNKLSTQANWSPNTAPLSSTSETTLSFSLGTSDSLDFDSDFGTYSLTFSQLISPYEMSLLTTSTRTLTVGLGGITLLGQGKVTTQLPVLLAGSQTWTLSPDSTLEVSGALNGSSTETALSLEGGGLLLLKGALGSNISLLDAKLGIIALDAGQNLGSLTDAAGLKSSTGTGGFSLIGNSDTTVNNTLLTSYLAKAKKESPGVVLLLDSSTGGSLFSVAPDFTGFSITPVIGSGTLATLSAAPVLPADQSSYLFGGAGGTLQVTANLGDQNSKATSLSLGTTAAENGPTLVLSGDNTFTGGIVLDGRAVLLLDSTHALPAGTINLGMESYLGYTENAAWNVTTSSGVTPQGLIDQIVAGSSSSTSIIGFDKSNPKSADPLTISDSLDLTGYNGYLGTRSNNVVFSSSSELLTSGSLGFVTLMGGSLNLQLDLTNQNASSCVAYGLQPGSASPLYTTGNYTIGGKNSYSGSTYIYSSASFSLLSSTPFGTNRDSLITLQPSGFETSAPEVSLTPGANVNVWIPQGISASGWGFEGNGNTALLLGSNATGAKLEIGGSINGNLDISINGPVSLLGDVDILGRLDVNEGALSIYSGSSIGSTGLLLNPATSLLVSGSQSSPEAPGYPTEVSHLKLSSGATLGIDRTDNVVSMGGPERLWVTDLTLVPSSSNESLTTHLEAGLVANILSSVNVESIEGSSVGKWLIDKGTSTSARGGMLVMGAPLHSGITNIELSGASLLFDDGAFVSNALPTTLTNLTVTNGSLLGIIGSSGDSALDNNARLQNLLGKIGFKASFAGTLSLNAYSDMEGVFGGTETTIDLSGFAHANFSLGTNSEATILSGTNLLFSGDYKFGGGSGDLTVAANLSGAKGVSVANLFGGAQKVALTGTNTFTGPLSIQNAMVSLQAPTALPSGTTIKLGAGGYVNYYGNGSPLENFNTLLSRLDSNYSSMGAIGLESYGTPVGGGYDLDFSSMPRSFYLGTTSSLRIDSILAPTVDQTLRFLATDLGQVILDARLENQSGALSVVYGHPVSDAASAHRSSETPDLTTGRYIITGYNSYTGGTTLHGGEYSLTSSSAFGTGSISVASTLAPVVISAGAEFYKDVFINNNLSLIDGSMLILGGQQLNTEMTGAMLRLTGTISGNGALMAQTGVSFSGTNTYTGPTRLSAGIIGLEGPQPLGTGKVYIDSGVSLLVGQNGASLTNAVSFFDSLAISPSGSEDRGTTDLSFKAPVIMESGYGTLTLASGAYAFFNGGLGATNPNSELLFNEPTGTEPGGVAVINGAINSNLTRITALNTGIIFQSTNALPSTLSLDTGLEEGGMGLFGVAGPGDSTANNALLNTMLSRITAPSMFRGTLSLDSDPDGAVNSYGGVGYTLDLSAFSSAGYSLGSVTKATIAAGTSITLPAESYYRFGGGGGQLNLAASLSGGHVLGLESPEELPLTLTLSAANTLSGINVSNSFLIVGASGAVTNGTTIQLGANGYASYNPSSGLGAPADFFQLINKSFSASDNPIVGWDSLTPDSGGITLANPTIDLSVFGTNLPYLGTRSRTLVIESAVPLSIGVGAGALRFAALQGAEIDIRTQLLSTNNITQLVFGHPSKGMTLNRNTGSTGRYIVRSDNNYTGGTSLLEGELVIGHNNALGTGSLVIAKDAINATISPLSGGNYSITNAIVTNAPELRLGPAEDDGTSLTLNGVISGSSMLELRGAVSLGGANTYTGGTFIDPDIASDILITNNTGLSTGPVMMGPNATLIFSTLAPEITNLTAKGGHLILQDGANLSLTQDSFTVLGMSITGGTPDVPTSTTASVSIDAGSTANIVVQSSSTYSGGTTLTGMEGSPAQVSIYSTGTPLGTGSVTLSNISLHLGNPATVLNNGIVLQGTDNTLSGIGTFSSSVSIGTGSMVRAGSRFDGGEFPQYVAGTLKFGSNLTFADGGSLGFVIQDPTGAPGVGYSTLLVNGTLNFDLGSSGIFTVIPSLGEGCSAWLDTNNNYSFVLAQAASITNFDATKLYLDTSSLNPMGTYNFALGGSDTQLLLNFTPVPEPETWAMMLGGSAALLIPLLRKRRKESSKGPVDR